jgi:hypothetical protein
MDLSSFGLYTETFRHALTRQREVVQGFTTVPARLSEECSTSRRWGGGGGTQWGPGPRVCVCVFVESREWKLRLR